MVCKALTSFPKTFFLISGEKFRQFDYGDENENIYGTSEPPEYDVSKIRSPIVLHYADNDWLAGTLVSSAYLLEQISNGLAFPLSCSLSSIVHISWNKYACYEG